MSLLEASHTNIRLFILKIVINRPDAFKNYSSYWIRPIMRTALTDLGNGFNYFVRDVCILFLKWGIQPKDTNEDRSVASQFMVIVHVVVNNL